MGNLENEAGRMGEGQRRPKGKWIAMKSKLVKNTHSKGRRKSRKTLNMKSEQATGNREHEMDCVTQVNGTNRP